MATSVLLACGCGKRYSVYVPKSILFGEWMQEPGDWDEVDKQEDADGEVKFAGKAAEMTGAVFVNLRDTERVLCSGCGKWLDLWTLIKARSTGV